MITFIGKAKHTTYTLQLSDIGLDAFSIAIQQQFSPKSIVFFVPCLVLSKIVIKNYT